MIGEQHDGLEVRIRERTTELAAVHETLQLRIAEHQRTEEALRASEERTRSIVETAHDAFIAIDAAGVITDWNRQAEVTFGWPRAEAIGQPFAEMLIPPEYRDTYRAGLLRFLETGEGPALNKRLDLSALHRDGHVFPVELTVSPLRLGQVHVFHAFVRDLTRLREAQERALQSERLAAIGEMVTGLAHESRNALQQIQSSVEMLTRRLQDRPEAQLVCEIQKAQDRLLRLFEDIRGYAAPVHLERCVHNMTNIWREAWKQLSPLRTHRNVWLQEQTGDLDLNCVVDQYSMERAFHNILLNSLTACGDPAMIEIHCSETDIGGQCGVRLAIRDNGPGLNPEQRTKIFEPFYTTKSKGTGLGMAITKRVVEAHGGKIDVGPDRGQGTEIVITLPRGNK